MNLFKTLAVGLLLPLGFLASCSENISEEEEFVDWKLKNEQAYLKQLEEAKTAIATARQTYGEQWESHCPWRVYRTYAQDPEVPGTPFDTVCVKILEKGDGATAPLYTDTVEVNFLLRLQPSTSHPEGLVADHSGPLPTEEGVFSPDFAQPATMRTSNTVEGFTTALLYMHEGDRWQVYIPYQLGYGGTASSSLPAYSMLTFDMQLVKIRNDF